MEGRAFVKTSKFNFCSTKFYRHMDYSPWSERENWPKFKRSAISETGVAVPTKIVCMHFTLTSTCMIFWADSIFWPSWSKGKILLFLKTKKGAKSWNRRSHAHQNWFAWISCQPLFTWICLANSIFWPLWTSSPWSEREIWQNNY